MRWIHFLLVWTTTRAIGFAAILTALPLAAAGQIDDLSQPVSIAGDWAFRTGDDPAWALPAFDDTDWSTIRTPLTWVDQGYEQYTGIAWYRLDFQLGQDIGSGTELAIHLGKVHSAYEIFANGERLGGVGSLPPTPTANYDKMMTYRIPARLIGADGQLTIALRVWGGGTEARTWEGGAYSGDFLIGDYRDLVGRALLRDIIPMVLFFLYLFIGFYHLYLFQRHPELRNYLWFGLLAIDIGIYTFMVSQWSQEVGWSFLTKKKLEYGVVYVQPALWIQMISSFIGFKIPKWLRAYQLSFLLFVIPIVVVQNLDIHFQTLKYWQVWTLLLIISMPLYITWMAWKKNPQARMLWFGLLIFGLTAMNDILIDLVHISMPHLVPFGFFAIILCMMISLANSFSRMYAQLEDEVDARTRELSIANEKLNRISITDLLTGMLNRRGFNEVAMREVSRTERYGQSFALIVADIDNFKLFNDKYGHACGDAVLQQVAAILKAHLRQADSVGRWGGEEFIFLLPVTGIAGGRAFAEKLRTTLEETEFEFDNLQFRISMTFGVTEFTPGDTIEACIARADDALYLGKTSGRNCVKVVGG